MKQIICRGVAARCGPRHKVTTTAPRHFISRPAFGKSVRVFYCRVVFLMTAAFESR